MKELFRRLMEPILASQARRVLKRHRPIVVAVGGSVGKTSTRLAIAAVLRQEYGRHLLESTGNYNSEIGLPLAIFGQETPEQIANPFAWLRILWRNEQAISHYSYKCLVLELGTDKPGDIAAFMRWLHPQIGVVTMISPEHMANFANEQAVAREEFELARGSELSILNAASPFLKELAAEHTVQPQWYSLDSLGGFGRLNAVKRWPEQIRLALAAAVEVGKALKVSTAKIEQGLGDFNGAPGRMQELAGRSGSQLIDDTYNSSPAAVEAALEALRAHPGERKIAVLGQMNELGEGSPEYHRLAGRQAAWVDRLVTIGRDANTYLGPAAVEAGLKPECWQKFDSAAAAGAALELELQKGDIVLIKGSQNGVFAEECTKRLLADPQDVRRLVRQSPQWLIRKDIIEG